MLLTNFNAGFSNGQVNAKKMNGDNVGFTALNQLSNQGAGCTYAGLNVNNAFHVMIGAGTTEVTRDDYDLADISIVASDKMAPIQQTATYTEETGVTVTTSWQNMSSENITVNEVGLAYKQGNPSYSKSANILISRRVLDNPVTIQPGETYIFSYNIRV